MISTSVKELKLLQDAVEKGIIDITKVNREMQMIKEKEILASHMTCLNRHVEEGSSMKNTGNFSGC